MNKQTEPTYEFGRFRLNPADRLLCRDGEVVALTPKCFDILWKLVENRGHLVGKDELMKTIWPDSFVEEGNLTQNISLLRRALSESSEEPQYIETVPRHGYRFVAEVREVQERGIEPIPEERARSHSYVGKELIGVAASIQEEAESRPQSAGAQTREILRLTMAAAALAGLVIAAVVFLNREKAHHPVIKSLAVLPLQNLSGDPEQEYFADGMTDALIGGLSKIGALRVISRTSVMRYKSTQKTLPEIGRELKVDAVVEGTVLRSGDRVRISAQLIDANTDEHLWSASFEYDLRDILSLQSEVARTVAQEIQIKITPEEQARLKSACPVNRSAYLNYLRGRYHRNKITEEQLNKAIQYLQSAIDEDPAYAPAHAGLADCYNQLMAHGVGYPPAEFRPRAIVAARKALEIDDSLAEAHATLANILHYNCDWLAAEKEFKRALELNPNDATAHRWYSQYFASRGEMQAALNEVDRALELDPLSAIAGVIKGWILEFSRDYEKAIHQYRSVLEMDPNFVFALWSLGRTYAYCSMFDKGIETLERAVALSGKSPGSISGSLGEAYAMSGRRAEAKKLLGELIELSKQRYVTPAAFVPIYVGLGDNDQAFHWLEKAYQERSTLLAHIKVYPFLDPLRSDPRFEDLLRRVGLGDEP
jgi:TolB-like protein/DNA-binding winged helix-turn-helix (wHTH) protein/Tfp pilus assembly protein PilF